MNPYWQKLLSLKMNLPALKLHQSLIHFLPNNEYVNLVLVKIGGLLFGIRLQAQTDQRFSNMNLTLSIISPVFQQVLIQDYQHLLDL